MRAVVWRSFLVFSLLLAGACAPAPGNLATPPPATPAAQPFDYLGSLRKAESELAEAEAAADAGRKSLALQALGTGQSLVGDTERATVTTAQAFRQWQSTEVEAKRNEAKEILARYEVRPALEAIAAAARDRQIVILNEAHHVPRDRAFATLVALELRKLGFEYLGVEALWGDTDALAARGYPIASDGSYTREPVFGDFLRRALAAGYQPVAYEKKWGTTPPPTDPVERVAQREEGQAQNLVDRVLAKNPHARLLIHVGYGHLSKGLVAMGGGRQTAWMAERLRTKTGIDPLCIDQAIPANTAMPLQIALRDVALAAFDTESFVLRSRERPGVFWPALDSVNMVVLHRPTRIESGRPHWLAMNGYREPRAIPTNLLPESGSRLVQAFVAGESAEAVPMDQVLVTAGEKPPVLMLPKGKFRFAFQE